MAQTSLETATGGVRIHVCMQEPFERGGGLHSYVRALVGGQEAIGLRPVVIDRIKSGGRYSTAHGDSALLSTAGSEPVTEYHFAPGAFPFLYYRPPVWHRFRRVFHFHGPWFDEGRVQGDSPNRIRAKRMVERLVYSRFDTFMVASSAFGSLLEREFRIPPAQINIVSPGVDTLRFSADQLRARARARLRIDHQGPVMLAVRRLEPRMGLEDAIRAMEFLPDAVLVIAGKGSSRAGLELLAIHCGVGDRVFFPGYVPDHLLPGLYRAANVSLVPTLSLEGFGMVVLESMASGTPVVSTRVGGLVEAMGPFAAEYTVAAGDPPALAAAAARAMTAQGLEVEVRRFAETKSVQAMAIAVENAIHPKSAGSARLTDSRSG